MKKILLVLLFLVAFLAFSQTHVNFYEKFYKNTTIVIVMFDGFGETYLKSTDLPTINKFSQKGFMKMVDALMPTVTNCNNASICCGEFPDKVGITGNSFLDEHGHEEYMESKDLVMAPTIFEKLNKYGTKSAIISSKKKSVALLGKGTQFALSPESPDSVWVQRIGKTPPIYSSEVNYWVMDAALYTLRNMKEIKCLYVHTTDYPMHTWAPDDSNSIRHLKKIDWYLGKISEEFPEAMICVTADHDVNHKNECVDIERSLGSQNLKIKAAISAERDKYLKHHRGFGGTSFVYLNSALDEKEVRKGLLKIKGVKTVLTKAEACKKYHLMPDRVGDLIVLADSLTVFGNIDTEREKLPATYRTHGSEYELKVPLILYNAPKLPSANYFKYNKDLIAWLFTNK